MTAFLHPPRDVAPGENAPTGYYPAGVPRTLEYPDIPAWCLLEHAAADYPDRIAVRANDRVLTYRDLWNDAMGAACVLRDRGVQPGDRVAVLLPNVPEYITALHGIWLAGGIAVAISPLAVAEEVDALLGATDCRTVITLDLLAGLVLSGTHVPQHCFLVTLRDQLPAWQQVGYWIARRKRTGHWVLRETEHLHWFNAELATPRGPFNPDRIPDVHEPAYILPTGGTTGAPKAVVLSHRNLIANAWQQYHWAGQPRGEDVLLAVLPFFHSYGLSATLLTGMAMGATLVMHHRFNTRVVLKLIEQHRPTVFHAVPAMLKAMNEQLRKKRSDLSSLRWVISGGAGLPAPVADEFADYSGALVCEGYGLSEASPVTHVGPLNDHNKRGSIGLPLPDTDARIVDLETGTRTLGVGEVGELIVRGPQVMLGYWNDLEASRQAVRGGWLHTGDMATCDEEGFYRIVDRKKDLIITSGFNVYPTDVEHVLRKHPDIQDVAIIGVPDDRRGETVKAMVVLKKGVTFHQSRLEEFCCEHLSHHKRPRLWEVVEGDLPRNFLGKVLRRHLRTGAQPQDDTLNEPHVVTPPAATIVPLLATDPQHSGSPLSEGGTGGVASNHRP